MIAAIAKASGVDAPIACRSCSAPIVFARSVTGKLAPFELDPAGEWIIVGGAASHQGKAPEHLAPSQVVPRWSSHFATCPNSKEWRRR